MSEKKKNGEEAFDVVHSKLDMVSYGFSAFISELISQVFVVYLIFFYEVEIGLNIGIVALAFGLYSIWNALNNPIIGYLTDRPFRFTKRWGRRFPWITLSVFPWIFCLLALFLIPDVDPVEGQWILFFWLFFFLCLYDTFRATHIVNTTSLFPDKYRDSKERRTASGIIMIMGTIGVALGSLLPPIIIGSGGNKQVYASLVWIAVIISCVGAVLKIPGTRENKIMVGNYLQTMQEKKDKGENASSLFKELKDIVKHKNFIAYIIFYICYQMVTGSLLASIAYGVRFILRVPGIFQTYIMAGYLIGSLAGIPLWIKLGNKTENNKKILMYGGILMSLSLIPMIFIENLLFTFIVITLFGFSLGAIWISLAPIRSEIIDEAVVNTHRRNEGMYSGLISFIISLTAAIKIWIFALIHELTGFVENAQTYAELELLSPTPELALWGIRMQMALIPLIWLIVGTLIFWKFYKLTPEKNKAISNRLKELGL